MWLQAYRVCSCENTDSMPLRDLWLSFFVSQLLRPPWQIACYQPVAKSTLKVVQISFLVTFAHYLFYYFLTYNMLIMFNFSINCLDSRYLGKQLRLLFIGQNIFKQNQCKHLNSAMCFKVFVEKTGPVCFNYHIPLLKCLNRRLLN